MHPAQKRHRQMLIGLITLLTATLTACAGGVGSVGSHSSSQAADPNSITIGLLPRLTSNVYYTATNQGAQEAAKELGIEVLYNGPVNADTNQQSQIINQWTQQGVTAICVAANDTTALVPALQQAHNAGITVTGYDSDWSQTPLAHPFMSAITDEAFAKSMVDMLAKQANGQGNFLIITGTLTSPNQNRWIDAIRAYIAANYPDITITDVEPSNADFAGTRSMATNYFRAHPDLTGVLAVDNVGLAGAATAAEQLDLAGNLIITGLSDPETIRAYVHSGTIKQAAIWNPVDLGYAAVYMTYAQIKGTLDPTTGTFPAGRLGNLTQTDANTITLGPPFIFDKDTVDNYEF